MIVIILVILSLIIFFSCFKKKRANPFDTIKFICSKHKGIIKKIPENHSKLIRLFANMQMDFAIIDTGKPIKFELSEDIANSYICKHLWKGPNNTTYTEEISIIRLYNICNGNLHPMIHFCIDENTFDINMDNFNKIIIPQFEKEFTESLENFKIPPELQI